MKMSGILKWGFIRVVVLALMVSLALVGCSGGGSILPKAIAPDPPEPLTEGVYTGVLIITTSPVLEYGQKALDDPSSLPKLEGEDAEQCEELDLNDEEVRKQVQEALDKGKGVLGKEVPTTITIKKGDDGALTCAIKVDFKAAFPEEECEEAKEEPYILVHEPGKINMTATQDQQGEKLQSIFDGKILKGGILEGTYKMTTDNAEYKEYTTTDSIIEGTFKVTKSNE